MKSEIGQTGYCHCKSMTYFSSFRDEYSLSCIGFRIMYVYTLTLLKLNLLKKYLVFIGLQYI